MYLGGIQFPCFNPYIKSTVEIYISGCTRKCPGCHNPELQDFNFGKVLQIEELLHYLKERESLFSYISISGGDLLCQDEIEAMHLASTIKLCFPEKKLWLFTGAELKDCPTWTKKVFSFIKTGIYNASKQSNEPFPASSNQKLHKQGIDY